MKVGTSIPTHSWESWGMNLNEEFRAMYWPVLTSYLVLILPANPLSSAVQTVDGIGQQQECLLTKAWAGELIFLCLPPGEFLSFADDLLSGLGTSCVAAGRSHGEVPEVSIYSVIFKCLEPDGLYK